MKNLDQYKQQFSIGKFWKKLSGTTKKLGVKAVYVILLLFYAYRRKETPTWAKSIVLGTLGYFLSPIDAIPDLSPIIGYTDDIGVLSFGLVTIAAYINNDVRENAKSKLSSWFKDYEPEDLAEVDKKL